VYSRGNIGEENVKSSDLVKWKVFFYFHNLSKMNLKFLITFVPHRKHNAFSLKRQRLKLHGEKRIEYGVLYGAVYVI
jgi:hypothetical protein